MILTDNFINIIAYLHCNVNFMFSSPTNRFKKFLEKLLAIFQPKKIRLMAQKFNTSYMNIVNHYNVYDNIYKQEIANKELLKTVFSQNTS